MVWAILSAAASTGLSACATATDRPTATSTEPSEQPVALHLDDIHFIVTDEAAAVQFFHHNFGAREMAHPGERFGLVRFLGLAPGDPTITITRIGPYDELPADRNARWISARIVTPASEVDRPVYGPRWLAIATPDLESARTRLRANGVKFLAEDQKLPMEPDVRAFAVAGPDGARIVVVERSGRDFGEAEFAVDHVQVITPDLSAGQALLMQVFGASQLATTGDSSAMDIAGARIVLSRPQAFGLDPDAVGSRTQEGTIRIGLDHLGVLYADVPAAFAAAAERGYTPLFPATRYIYRGKPTVYTFSAFGMPGGYNIEMVSADGRVGPQNFYMDQNQSASPQ